MPPSLGFWNGFKRVLLALIVLGLVAAILFFVLIPDAKGTLLGAGTLVLVLNLGLMLLFTRINDKRRPSNRWEEEKRRFDIHHKEK